MSTLNYTTYLAQISNLMVIPSTDSNFTTMLPGMIEYADNRIYRELDLIYTQVTDTGITTASARDFTLPTTVGTFITADVINVFSSVGATSSNGKRNPVTAVSREFIDAVYPSGSSHTGIPEFFAMNANPTSLTAQLSVIFGPSPDAAYTVEVVGTQRPTVLSSGNSSTILTVYVPDLYIAASMVFGAGYMRDFGSQADQPGMGQSWESQYNLLMKSAATEQFCAKFQSEGWTSQSPSPIATPKRV